ncbi:MAG: DUF91 domain-containing protein [Lachnospiraceae bacterium]|nr:DUF91 domain-containing protein [Lachnospiraceae bacterium]
MYYINRDNKTLEDLKEVKFDEVGIKERSDIQEWIVSKPDILGEELLIIQKEYDDFDATKDRLDLLAIDKKGNLVVVENKRDEAGKDVIGQVIRYASYFATATKDDVISLYDTQKHNDQ